MSQTLDQIYITNPTTTLLSTDIFYLVKSPYTAGNDSAISYSNFLAGLPLSSGGLTAVSVSGTTQTASIGNTYILNNYAATTVTLPVSSSSTIGSIIKIKGRSAASWIIRANTGQTIKYGSTASTVAGTATSAAGSDSIQLTYVAANEWSVDWSVSSAIVLA